MKGSKRELKVVANCYYDLVTVIRNNLDEASLFLYKKDIITKQTHDEVTNMKSVYGAEDRAKMALRALGDKIEEDDENYYMFVSFLSHKKKHSKLLNSLIAAYSNLGMISRFLSV